MTRIVICRHGNTFDKGDVVTRVGARTDLPLSLSGQIQAGKLTDELSGFNFTKAYCSPLLRTRETAEAILSEHRATLSVLEFLTEIDYGVDENKPEAEVIKRVGKDAIDLWDRKAIPPQGWNVDPKALQEAWQSFFNRHNRLKGDVLILTSNGVARFVLDVVTGVMPHTPRKLRTAAFGLVSSKPKKVELLYWDRRNI